MSRRYCIVGTAGHIDHGKSSLVRALTGTDPDRLPEEKSRGMTIELGFARLVIPASQGEDELEIGFVDVPGHERFIRTMVAGATGVDLAMLVVAADDGVMPQTREHIEILDFLGIERGLVVISKCDAVQASRVDDVREEVGRAVTGTVLQGWPMVATSARTGAGLDDVKRTMRGVHQATALRSNPYFRMAIDRVFSVHGRGTVVTGSVLSGMIATGAALELLPAGISVKVREVQSHGASVDSAGGGQRAAINLTGVEKDAIDRGMELATPGVLVASRYVDARVRIVNRLESPFESHQRVRVSMGTTEAIAMLVVIGGDEIPPGATGFAQLRFNTPVVAAFGQRFILRNEAAQYTVGGGQVVRPVSRRVRPHHRDTVDALDRANSSDPYVRLGEAIRRYGFHSVDDARLACEIGIEASAVAPCRARMAADGSLVKVGARELHRETIASLEQRALGFLLRHHQLKPGEPGVAKDRFVGWVGAKAAAGMGREIFSRLEQRGEIVVKGPYVAHRDFRPAMSAEDAAALARIVQEIEQAGFDPPEWAKLNSVQSLSRQRSKALEDLARTEPRLISFAPQMFISAEACEQFRSAVEALGAGGRRFKLADVRDKLGLTRRVVQPLLEHLDRTQFTKRVGDERVLMERD